MKKLFSIFAMLALSSATFANDVDLQSIFPADAPLVVAQTG